MSISTESATEGHGSRAVAPGFFAGSVIFLEAQDYCFNQSAKMISRTKVSSLMYMLPFTLLVIFVLESCQVKVITM